MYTISKQPLEKAVPQNTRAPKQPLEKAVPQNMLVE